MADRHMLLRPGDPYIWDGDYILHYNDDGFYQKGISKSYTTYSTGQYSGQTNIVINGSTDEHTNSVVVDNRTGLMWNKSVPYSIGPYSDGRLYWDDHVHVIKHGGSGTTFSVNDVITQLNTTYDAAIRYVLETTKLIGIYNATTYPFSTVAANTITGAITGGPSCVVWYREGAKEDIWQYAYEANNSSLSGHSDWRVPNAMEMLTIMNFSATAGHAFPSSHFDVGSSSTASTSVYWTGSDSSAFPNTAYGARLNLGYLQNYLPNYGKMEIPGYVFLVRNCTDDTEWPCKPLVTGCYIPSEPGWLSDGYYRAGEPKSILAITTGTGTTDSSGTTSWTANNGIGLQISKNIVEDAHTGLTWTQAPCIGSSADTAGLVPFYDPEGLRNDAVSIMRMINELGIGGYHDWRFPNIMEAASIMDLSSQAMQTAPFYPYQAYTFWINTVVPSDQTRIYYYNVAYPYGSGLLRESTSTISRCYVRAVRGGYTDEDL